MRTFEICLVIALFGSTSAAQCGTPTVQNTPQKQSDIAERQKSEPNYVGTVKVVAVVTQSGRVCGIAISQSVGKQADKLAVDTLGKWKFSPAMKDGKPVVVMIQVAVDLIRNPRTGQIIVKQASGPPQKSS